MIIHYRSDRASVLFRPLANRWLNLAVMWELALLVMIIYTPFFHDAFGTYALSVSEWGIIVGLTLTVVPVLELAKWMVRKGWFGKVE